MRTAFYSGSFDPPTLGHLDMMRKSLQVFDRLVVGIGVHPSKSPLFSDVERLEMISTELKHLNADGRGEAVLFHGLTVDAARKFGATVIVRGLRDANDLTYEMQMAGMNKVMAPEIVTVFLSASPEVSHITSTLVRQIAGLKGDASPFVSPRIADRIAAKLQHI